MDKGSTMRGEETGSVCLGMHCGRCRAYITIRGDGSMDLRVYTNVEHALDEHPLRYVTPFCNWLAAF